MTFKIEHSSWIVIPAKAGIQKFYPNLLRSYR
jgi:hypothetical protein